MGLVLVTGGTGHLGRDVVRLMKDQQRQVRILARRPGREPGVDWVGGDLATGEGVEAAVSGVQTIVHAATLSPAAQRGGFRAGDFFRSPPDVDVDGTRRLLAQARRVGVEHFVHVSIVGVQQARVPYSRVKAAAEDLVRTSGVPYSIVPATEFLLVGGPLPGQRAPLDLAVAIEPGVGARGFRRFRRVPRGVRYRWAARGPGGLRRTGRTDDGRYRTPVPAGARCPAPYCAAAVAARRDSGIGTADLPGRAQRPDHVVGVARRAPDNGLGDEIGRWVGDGGDVIDEAGEQARQGRPVFGGPAGCSFGDHVLAEGVDSVERAAPAGGEG